MENTDRDPIANAIPNTDWQNAKTIESMTVPGSQINEIGGVDESTSFTEDRDDEHIHAMAGIDVPDPDDEDEDDKDEDEVEEEEAESHRDWGHVDPAEGNSPFPDPNAPTSPGSAV